MSLSLLLISFVAGMLTLLSPCVLPLLPVIVGGSVNSGQQDKWRPVIVTASLSFSLVLFTLLLKATTVFITVPPRFWSIVSGIIVVLFGLITLFPHAWEVIATRLKFSDNSNKLLTNSAQKNSRWGSVFVGMSLGPVFSSCSPTYAIILEIGRAHV